MASYEYEDDCPDCDGRGVDRKGRVCSECHGEGYILTLASIRESMAS